MNFLKLYLVFDSSGLVADKVLALLAETGTIVWPHKYFWLGLHTKMSQ